METALAITWWKISSRWIGLALGLVMGVSGSWLQAQEKPGGQDAVGKAKELKTTAGPAGSATDLAVNLRALRLGIEELRRTFPNSYVHGQRYWQRLEAIEKRLGPKAAGELTFDPEALALRHQALLANPLLDFDRLLLVRRRDGATLGNVKLHMPFINDRVGHLNGLPSNFQGNSVLREIPFSNEIAVLSPVHPQGKLTTLYKPEKPVFVGDLDLHFDAGRLLFSSIGSHNRWQIFEIGSNGKGLRQVSRGEADDIDNYDACYLPDGRIVFSSSACFQSVPCERRLDETANLFLMQADGSGMRRLCFDQDHNFYPTVLNDGRILYLRWEYADLAHAFSGRLFTMNPDGTHQRALYGSSSYWPNRIFFARPVPGHATRLVGIVSGHHGTARAGELILFDVARGQRQADGAVQRIPGYGQPVKPKLVDHLVDGVWPRFLHPYPLSDKFFLAACQPSKGANWGLYLVDVFDNMVLLHEEPGHVLFEPVPIRPRPLPPVLPDRTTPKAADATVYIADVYAGEGLKGVPRGTVKHLRLFTYHFNYFGTSALGDPIGADGPWDVRRVLGTVPVDQDGSAYFYVPANTPIAVQPLDAEGKAWQLMRSWFTARPGEKVSCIGCHERAKSTPPMQPLAALQRSAAPITPWYGPTRGFSWSREVQPVLDRYCVGCHDGQPVIGNQPSAVGPQTIAENRKPLSRMPIPDLRGGPPVQFTANGQQSKARFPLSFWHLRRYVRSPGLEGDPQLLPTAEYHADSNLLVQMLRSGHHGVRLDKEAWDRLLTWMDLNAPAYGSWLEMPTIEGRRAMVEQCVARRKESQKLYGGSSDDPEAVPPMPTKKIVPVIPPPLRPAAEVQLQGWPLTAEQAVRLQAKAGRRQQWTVDLGDSMRLAMILVPAGEFVMGDAAGADNERSLRRVKIDRPFWLGKFEISNGQYRRFDPAHDSGAEPILGLKWSSADFFDLAHKDKPVCRVSWNQALAFCRWLSERTGQTFSLPTEEQWEWACRAGSNSPLNFGQATADYQAHANLADASFLRLFNSELMPPFLLVDQAVNDGQIVAAPVGTYKPNVWGLFDMHGNVAEWTASPELASPAGGRPVAGPDSVRRVVRGGSWSDPARLARSGRRISYHPWQGVYNVGFRVACPAEAAGP